MSSLDQVTSYSLQPVHDEECERLVIGTLLQRPSLLDENGDILSEDCFYNARLRTLFTAIRKMMEEGRQVDVITLPPYLEKTVKDMTFSVIEIIELTNHMILNDCREKCMYLYELAHRRRLLYAGLRLVNAGISQQEDLEKVLTDLDGTLENIHDTPVSSITTSREALEGLTQNVLDNQDEHKNIFDYSGILCMDERAFLRPQALTVIAAYSGHGKSCLATSITYNCAKEGAPVAYYSLEMSKEELMARAVSPVCDIPTSRILYGKLNKEEMKRFRTACLKLGELPVFFDERATVSADALFLSIRQMVRQKHVHGVVIDYLQILSQNGRPKNQTEESFLGGVIRALKNIAKQMNIWIIVLSQISRNHDSEEPKESYLRGSGQILEGCDNCVLLYRPAKHEGVHYSGANSNVDPRGTAELNICKARNGSDGKRFIIGFDPEHTHFYQLVDIPQLDGGVAFEHTKPASF